MHFNSMPYKAEAVKSGEHRILFFGMDVLLVQHIFI